MLLLPLAFLWLLQVKEWHPPSNRTDFSSCAYYWDFSRGPLVASRQENNVLYSRWRQSSSGGTDVPWNVFWAFNGTISAAFLSLDSARVSGKVLGAYDAGYWPRDMASVCAEQARGVLLPEEFGGRFGDGLKNATLFSCRLAGMSRVALYADGETGRVARIRFSEPHPMWNRQVWDVVAEVAQSDPYDDNFIRPPEWISAWQ